MKKATPETAIMANRVRILKNRSHILSHWDGNAKSSFHRVSGPASGFSDCFHNVEKTADAAYFSETPLLPRTSKSF